MNYGLKYTVPFRTVSEVDCVINLSRRQAYTAG